MSIYLFALSPGEENDTGTFIVIVEEGFFKTNGCLKDQHISEEMGDLLPEGFDEIAESVFHTELTFEETREVLNAKGLREEPNLHNIGMD